ncbi:MAG: 16S rRNA (cytidine(1402)-2'-O)-methyltransferase [Chloroflexi bacterium]|nr:16S rRNA (cytidine(1402)-2'-O)-methyltransferase [Chloroflexota bacterium]MYK62488.1 16S rRNA (cytidine(1402)-2'-O)-methyltransferase [Chloroflexota bacterium]
MPTLYIVATPIGNLDDLSLRAIELLRSVSVVVAEDTRVTRKLLDRVESTARLISFHRRSGEKGAETIVRLLDDGDVALVSDAGTPGVNDPGQAIVAAAIHRGHDVVPIPGASSVMAALSVCGFYADQFASYGFLPANGSRRRRVLRQIAGQSMAAVMFETPHRLRDALADTAEILGDRHLVICREMTKMHEEIWRGTADEALLHFEKPRGEFVVVVAPLERSGVGSQAMSAEDAEREILNIAAELDDEYESRRDLVDAVAAEIGYPRRQVYQVLHRQR